MSWPLDLPQPPKISAQAENLRSYLALYTGEHGGETKVMQNPRHLWEEVFDVANAGKPRMLVCCMGETPRGGFAQANTLHRVDRQWTVTILMGHGFVNNVSTPTEDTAIPFLDVVETIRDGLRIKLDLSEEFPLDYKGFATVPGAGPNAATNVFLDGYIITFSTANDIPAILTS